MTIKPKYGTPEYTKQWRDNNKDRLAAERYEKYHNFWKPRYQRRWILLNQYKCSKGCESCGYNKHGVALDFDHIDPSTKIFCVSHRICNATVKRLFSEIRKCRILCANCHRIKTLNDKQL